MNQQTAVIIGATGLIGSYLLQQVLNDEAFTKVRILVRRPLKIDHPKLEAVLVDFNNYDDYKNKLGKGDCIFCCIGTTNAMVKGNKTEYRKIDFDIPVNAARFGKENGFTQFLIVTALGANSKSRFFYNRLKGEVEEVLSTFHYPSLHIFRPSFLLGKRNEQRAGESIFKSISKSLAFLLPSSWKPIEAADVAKALIIAAKEGKAGINFYYFKEMSQK